ncbi:MAG: hypothetical protein M3018_13265 [Actinomycetota bacterium]|nr:hypothetical protein [Actinomycetota bacterium]
MRGAPDNPGHDSRARPSLTLPELERWVEHGADWRVLEVSEGLAVVELRTCYGDPVDTLQSTDPSLIAYVRSHRED